MSVNFWSMGTHLPGGSKMAHRGNWARFRCRVRKDARHPGPLSQLPVDVLKPIGCSQTETVFSREEDPVRLSGIAVPAHTASLGFSPPPPVHLLEQPHLDAALWGIGAHG